jgi:hypothetical protein
MLQVALICLYLFTKLRSVTSQLAVSAYLVSWEPRTPPSELWVWSDSCINFELLSWPFILSSFPLPHTNLTYLLLKPHCVPLINFWRIIPLFSMPLLLDRKWSITQWRVRIFVLNYMFGLVLSVGRSAASVPSHVSFIHLRLLRSECSNTPSKSVNLRQ